MRMMTQNMFFMPLFRKRIHFGLVDMARQPGSPNFFWTFALYEWSIPYHEYVIDETTKTLAKKLRRPVVETMHLAHLLMQTNKRIFLGLNTNNQSNK